MIRGLVLALLVGVSARAATPQALLLYDGKSDIRAEGVLSARYIANLLGHFNVTSESRPIESYQKGDTERYPYVFFAGHVSRTTLPKDFLADVSSTDTHVIWLGRHIEQLVGRSPADQGAQQFGFRFLDYHDDGEFDAVVYHNLRIPKGDPDLNLVV